LHSIIGYQSSGVTAPAIVVMPTGTGKTETMVAWMVAARPSKVLVIVPSVVLRNQVAEKFETLGILQSAGAVASTALRPCVVRLGHRIETIDDAARLVEHANVIVATPQALHASEPDVRERLIELCTHLVVDEAHHAPADTWTEVVRGFADRPVLLFTATPFRSDGRALPGKTIFRFPLREAQRHGFFSKIDFKSVIGLGDPDEELAKAAVQRLRSDLAAGLEHVMLARAANKTRAAEILALYEQLAGDLQPRLLVDKLSQRTAKANLEALRGGTSKIIVCVDMLGEGFDLPTLKVVAFHDPRRSLSPMIQLVGRVARTVSTRHVGTASVFIMQEPRMVLPPMRQLLREDPDWNTVLSDVTDSATARAEEVSEFDASFDAAPPDVPVKLLQPKMSAIAFRTSATEWDPLAAHDVYGDRIMDDVVSVSRIEELAWFVIENTDDMRWGHLPTLQQVSYDLIVMFFDRRHGLLFVHGSDTRKDYESLATAVLGGDAALFTGADTFRVFGGLDRLIPTNVGLLDAVDRDTRFSMYVGSHVETALTEAQSGHKSNTHIAAKAFDDGNAVTIAAAMSGRFWSMSTADGLIAWRDWCLRQGERLTDSTVDLQHVFRDMIIPVALTERPQEHLLAMEWPWELYLGTAGGPSLRHDGAAFRILDADLRVTDHSASGPFQFSVVTPGWEVAYTGTVGPTGMQYQSVGDDAEVEVGGPGHSVPLSDWMNRHKPTLFLSNDVLITGDDRVLRARTDLEPFDRSRLESLPWGGVNIRVESQGEHRRPDSIQAYVANVLRGEQSFDVLIDDDRAGEAADLVGLRIHGDEMIVTLVHCKFSTADTPGSRVADLYEVCGQAMRGARWRSNNAGPLLVHLDRRVRDYYRRTGGSAFEVGDLETLLRLASLAPQLYPRFETIIAQPGLSAVACGAEQLRLLAGADTYVRAVTKGPLRVLVSP
jgi:superfamily II DNA or RNA helicase